MNQNQMNVLIVDDEMELRKNVADILTTSIPEVQFQISEADNGKQAFELFEKGDFDLVIMDVRMPEMNGLEALKLIKESDPRTRTCKMRSPRSRTALTITSKNRSTPNAWPSSCANHAKPATWFQAWRFRILFSMMTSNPNSSAARKK